MRELSISLAQKKFVFLIPGIFLIAALFTGISVYWILFWFISIWFLLSTLWLLYTGKNLDMILELGAKSIERTHKTAFKVRLLNDTFLPFPYAKLIFPHSNTDELSEYRLFDDEEVAKEELEISDIVPLGSWHCRLLLQCLRRGYLSIGAMKVRLTSPFGILEVEREFDEVKTILVYPRLLPLTNISKSRGSEVQGNLRKQNILLIPMDYTQIHDLRPFVSGDSPKLIDWKVSARQGELYVKRMEDTGEKQVLLCLEFSQKYYKSFAEQDLIIEKALAIIKYFTDQNIPVGLVTLDEDIKYLPPDTGTKQLQLLRKSLTHLKGHEQIDLTDYLLKDPNLIREQNIIWLTPQLTEQYQLNLQKLRGQANRILIFLDEEMYKNNSDNYQNNKRHFGIDTYYVFWHQGEMGVREVISS